MKKKMKKTVAGILAILLLVGINDLNVNANTKSSLSKMPREGTVNEEKILNEMKKEGTNQYKIDNRIQIPNKVFNSDKEVGKLPGVTTEIYVENANDNQVKARTYGEGYVIGRVRTWKTASNGLTRKGSKVGDLASIGSFSLSFVGGIAAMTVSTILSVVGMSASRSDRVKAETYVSYRYTYRDGEGRWSSDPDKSGYWYLGYRTAQRETFKHVMGAKLNKATNKWSTKTKDYNTASKIEKTANFTKNNAWLAEKGRKNVDASFFYNESPW